MKRWGRQRVGAALLASLLAACSIGGGSGGAAEDVDFSIVSGSENTTLEPIVQAFADDQDVSVGFTYTGSVDIAFDLEDGEIAHDAVWPANGLWVELGDRDGLVDSLQSISRSPIVVAVKQSVAQELGWVDAEVRVADVLAAAEAGDLDFMMTSATQSNSGASAYFGFLSAFAGSPDVLTSADLADPEVRERTTRILGQIDRSSGSSGWLGDLFVTRYDEFDAMVNYESVMIETNQRLIADGREPLVAVYPLDGLTVSDSPLGYVDHGDAEQRAFFDALQAHLLSPEIQAEILATGRRTGPVGLDPEGADPAVFNPDWGIDLARVISPIRFPEAAVVREALDLYQTAFRKPSFTVFVVDYSGSMDGEGEEQLEASLQTLLRQDQADDYLLQAAPDDVTVVIPFDDVSIDALRADSGDPAAMSRLADEVIAFSPDGGTNIYDPVADAYRLLAAEGIGDRLPAIILMTDGEANAGALRAIEQARSDTGLDVPVYGILFGSASPDQVEEVAELTGGRVFDGGDGLLDAFRSARGYN